MSAQQRHVREVAPSRSKAIGSRLPALMARRAHQVTRNEVEMRTVLTTMAAFSCLKFVVQSTTAKGSCFCANDCSEDIRVVLENPVVLWNCIGHPHGLTIGTSKVGKRGQVDLEQDFDE